MKVRKISMFNQLFLFLAVLLLLGNGILGMLAYNRSQSALFQQIQMNAMNIAQCAAANVSGGILDNISVGDEEEQAYQIILDQIGFFRDNAQIEYIYTLRRNETGSFEFVVDSDLEAPAAIGDECEVTEALAQTFTEGISTADEESFTDEWGTHVSAYSPIFYRQEVVGAVGVDISATWISEQITGLRNLIVFSCIATYIVSLLVLQILIIKFKRSMKKLNEKVEELASGSGDLTKEVDIYSGDELEVIAGNMNTFIGQIRSLVKEVSQVTKDILVNGEELNTTVNENTRIMSDMSSEIGQISENMEQSSASSRVLSDNLAESAREIAEFAREVDMIRKEVQTANENAQAASAFANKNRKNALDSIDDLQARMRKTSQDARKIEQVRQIAEEIGHISAQTKMLSLNAQIEAARAGSMGAGFAVVATEVGNLSNEIDKAVREISQINAEVLAAVGALTEVSEEMIQFVSEDVVKDYDAFASLGEDYGRTTDIIRTQMADIGDQSERISKEISAINDNLQEIAETVILAADSANSLASSTNTISDSMENLNETSKKNSLHTESLNEMVKKYTF